MFTCTSHGPSESPVISLSGDLTLEHCREIQTELQARLGQAEAVTLDLRDSLKSDLSFIQILCALLKDQNKRIGFLPLPTHLVELAASLGADSLIKDITSRTEDKNE